MESLDDANCPTIRIEPSGDVASLPTGTARSHEDGTEEMNDSGIRQNINDALNVQTYDQFLQNAQQQISRIFDQQAVLIRQLQESSSYYQQYIQQLAVDQRPANSNIKDGDDDKEKAKFKEIAKSLKDCNPNESDVDAKSMKTLDKADKVISVKEKTDGAINPSGGERRFYLTPSEVRCSSHDGGGPDFLRPAPAPMEPAPMWTLPNMVQFKESEQANACKLTVDGHKIVMIRIPTHCRARCIRWVFATDNDDIGFGVYFKWCKSATCDLTIHVFKEDELEDNFYDEANCKHDYTAYGGKNSDPELGSERSLGTALPIVHLVPIGLYESHKEVCAGSHTYPGEGVYFLIFSNAYSGKSKTLYYKVYHAL